jgi:hypothetical protein
VSSPRQGHIFQPIRLACDDRDAANSQAASQREKYDIAPPHPISPARGLSSRHPARIGGVGSRVMFRGRYVAAVLVGLAVGVAAGWISSRGFESAHQAATTWTHAGHVRARALTPQPHSNDNPPRPKPQQRYLAPGLQQVQQRIVRCLYDSSTWQQQVVCLRAVLRLEVAGTRSLGLSFAGQPFRLVGQPLGQS